MKKIIVLILFLLLSLQIVTATFCETEYDSNDDGVIGIIELMKAIRDYTRGDIEYSDLKEILDYWKNGTCILEEEAPPAIPW